MEEADIKIKNLLLEIQVHEKTSQKTLETLQEQNQ
jgi:hypothetical protein